MLIHWKQRARLCCQKFLSPGWEWVCCDGLSAPRCGVDGTGMAGGPLGTGDKRLRDEAKWPHRENGAVATLDQSIQRQVAQGGPDITGPIWRHVGLLSKPVPGSPPGLRSHVQQRTSAWQAHWTTADQPVIGSRYTRIEYSHLKT